jgi:hypothetical protein
MVLDLEVRTMSDLRRSRTTAEPDYSDRRAQPTGWVGWVVFSGIMMIMLGMFEAIIGFVALFKEDYFVVPRSGLVISVDYTTWGWVHLLLGLVALLAGFCVLVGQMWARVVGIILAVVSAVANVAFLAAYPIWSTIVIVVDVLVIYALAVHGREVRAAYDD